jgi:hypothetical protein
MIKVCCLIPGCTLSVVLCPLPPLSACNTTCNQAYLCAAIPTASPASSSAAPNPHVLLSVGAIAGLAAASIVVAVIAVSLSDLNICMSADMWLFVRIRVCLCGYVVVCVVITFSVCHFHLLLLCEYNDKSC